VMGLRWCVRLANDFLKLAQKLVLILKCVSGRGSGLSPDASADF
jgi:hypothetical protein